jgi:CheY-like chemotaxis protein
MKLTYNDSVTALQNIRPTFYDLALLDITMPNMNGFELSDKIEKMDNKLKVCFISGYDVEDKALRKQFSVTTDKMFSPKANCS